MDAQNSSIEIVTKYLNENLSKLSQRDQDFASSLLESVARYGYPSSKQAYWLRILVERTAQEKKQPVEIGSLDNINMLFDKAATTLKRPSIALKDDTANYRLSVAGERSSNPGSINVTSTGSFENRTYYGRINRSGAFVPSPRVETPKGLVNLLRDFAADPAGVASIYGRETGACCFCSRELTDGRSIHVGYGPVCADRFGLPWGEKQEAA